MKHLSHFCLLTFISLTLGCASVLPTPSKTPKVTVVIDPNASLTFEGKGAGAGIMLMSTMGPAGIAIGVAIDVGIGKDIAKAYTNAQGQFDVKAKVMIEKALVTYCKQNALNHNQCTALSPIYIEVSDYGFKWLSNESIPWLVARLDLPCRSSPIKLDSTSLIPANNKTYATLEELKVNGKITEQQLADTLLQLTLTAIKQHANTQACN